MSFATLVALLGLISPGQDDPRELVARLVSPKSAERFAAEARLETLGDAAFPALIAATESTDLELRHRAAAFLDRMEGQRLTHATLVPLDFRAKPLREVAEVIGKAAGVTIVIEPDADVRILDKPITLKTDEPVTLWKAIHLLCTTAGLKLDPAMAPWMRQRQMFAGNPQLLRGRNLGGTELVLRPDDPARQAPMTESGAFQISVASLVFDRTKSFVRSVENPGKPESQTLFNVGLHVRAEPRLTLATVDQSHLIEAVDDRGQSLLMPATPSAPRGPAWGMQEGRANQPMVFSLKYPDTPGRVISRFRGTIRGMVIGRRGDPIVIPLEGSMGKSFTSGATTLSVQIYRPGGFGQQTSFDFTLDGLGGGNPQPQMFNTLDPRAGLRPPPTAMGQLEFLDAKGRVCFATDLGGFNGVFGPGNERRIQFIAPPAYGPPVEARYYGSVWSTVEIAFDFRDIPMP